jgi:hypothetical protein
VQCQFVAVKTGSSAVMSPAKKKMAKSFSSPAYSSDDVGFGSRPLPTPLLVLPLLLLVVWRGYGPTSAMAWGWKARAAGRLCFYSRARLWLWQMVDVTSWTRGGDRGDLEKGFGVAER